VPRLGGKVLNGPMEVPGGDWITQAMDPQGVVFAVHSKKVAAATAPAAKRKAAPPKKSKPAKRKSVPAKKSKTAKKKTARPKPRKAHKRRR
jgi:hypothetical protein